MENNEQPILGYKIMAGKEYMVFRTENAGRVYYKIQISKKNFDGTKEVGYKNIKFKRGIELEDRTIIIPKAGFEDFYNKDKYTTIFTLVITDFDIVPNPVVDTANAINNYNNQISQEEVDNFFNEEPEVVINDDDLPF